MTRVNAGTLYFVAGQLSVDRNGKIAGKHDFARQFRQVFENLEAVLKEIGTDFKDVVKFTTYLVHSQDIEKFMEQRERVFPENIRQAALSAQYAAHCRPAGERRFSAGG